MKDIIKSLEDEIRYMKPDKKSDLRVEGGALVSKGAILKILDMYKEKDKIQAKVPAEEYLITWINDNYASVEANMPYEDVIEFAKDYVQDELEYFANNRVK